MPEKIVFINQSTGYLTIDIINQFAPHYDKVDLIYGNIREMDVKLDNKVTKRQVLKRSRVSNVRRFLAWFFASIQIFFLLLFRYRKYEIFYFSLPPFAYLSSLLLKNKFSLVMFDVYPDVLKMLHVKETNIVYRFWAKSNKKLFAKAHKVYTIGDSLADLMAKYAPREKIEVIPLWTGLSNIKPVAKEDNPFIQKLGLQQKFIVQYSGNIGVTHNIESLLEAAMLLKDYSDIVFLIIGVGQKVPLVKKTIEEQHLNNCMLLSFQPDDVLKYSIAAADISVVLIDDKAANVSIPSKVYNIMAAGSSLLSISPKSSEINKLITKYDMGKNFLENDVQSIANYILQLKNEQEIKHRYSKNAIDASGNYTSANAQQFWLSYTK